MAPMQRRGKAKKIKSRVTPYTIHWVNRRLTSFQPPTRNWEDLSCFFVPRTTALEINETPTRNGEDLSCFFVRRTTALRISEPLTRNEEDLLCSYLPSTTALESSKPPIRNEADLSCFFVPPTTALESSEDYLSCLIVPSSPTTSDTSETPTRLPNLLETMAPMQRCGKAKKVTSRITPYTTHWDKKRLSPFQPHTTALESSKDYLSCLFVPSSPTTSKTSETPTPLPNSLETMAPSQPTNPDDDILSYPFSTLLETMEPLSERKEIASTFHQLIQNLLMPESVDSHIQSSFCTVLPPSNGSNTSSHHLFSPPVIKKIITNDNIHLVSCPAKATILLPAKSCSVVSHKRRCTEEQLEINEYKHRRLNATTDIEMEINFETDYSDPAPLDWTQLQPSITDILLPNDLNDADKSIIDYMMDFEPSFDF